MTPIPLYTSPTLKLAGLKPTENLLACSIRVSFQSGTYLEYEVQAPRLEPSGVERLVLSLLSICLSSPLRSFGKLLDVSSPQLNATIYAVKLHKSSSSVGLEEVLSSVCLTSLTIDSEDASQASGGKTILNVV